MGFFGGPLSDFDELLALRLATPLLTCQTLQPKTALRRLPLLTPGVLADACLRRCRTLPPHPGRSGPRPCPCAAEAAEESSGPWAACAACASCSGALPGRCGWRGVASS